MPKWLDRLLGKDRLSLRHIEAFNAAVQDYEAGAFDAAGNNFTALCDDKSCSKGLRMAAGYARAVADLQSGNEPTMPAEFGDRTDEMGARYAIFTTTGLLAKDGHVTAAPDGQTVVLKTNQGGTIFFYRITFSDAMGTLIADVSRIDKRGYCVHLDMEDDPNPQELDGKILDRVREAGTGSHDPVELPVTWSDRIKLPPEKPAISDTCTICLTLRGTGDLQRNVDSTNAVLKGIAEAFPFASRESPLILMGRSGAVFGIRFYPKPEMAEKVDKIERQFVTLFKRHGIKTTDKSIVNGTVREPDE